MTPRRKPGRGTKSPCTRVTVSAVPGQLAAGASIDELLADYPYWNARTSSPRSNASPWLRRSGPRGSRERALSEQTQAQHRAALGLVPTTRPRHTITETPPVQAALDELRARLGEDERIDFAELVALGAEVKVRRMATEDAAAVTARRRLAEMTRTGSFSYAVDVEAADEVKRLGLIANYDS